MAGHSEKLCLLYQNKSTRAGNIKDTASTPEKQTIKKVFWAVIAAFWANKRKKETVD